MSKKIVVGVTVAIIALVICLVPLKGVAYTVIVPYQDTETYYEDEPYEATETYFEAVQIDYHPELKVYSIEDVLWFDLYIQNKYTEPLDCFVVLKFPFSEGGTYGFTQDFCIKPGKTEGMSGPVCSVQGRDFTYDCKIYPIYKSVEKQRTVTKYRQVEKQRTVTKERPETRYKKITLLDYLLYY